MKSIVSATFSAILLSGTLLMSPTLVAGSRPTAQENTAKPDNTRVNKRDRAKGAVTAGQQKENSTDRQTTRKIRRAVMKDRSLSMYAHNVKIITRDGMVTLKGPVRSEAEKQAIETKAKQIAGDDKVTNQLDVKQ